MSWTQRVPSFCDRVLWHCLPSVKDRVQCTGYDSVETIGTSDHKPVWATFTLKYVTFGLVAQIFPCCSHLHKAIFFRWLL